jgi:hypothetical protein
MMMRPSALALSLLAIACGSNDPAPPLPAADAGPADSGAEPADSGLHPDAAAPDLGPVVDTCDPLAQDCTDPSAIKCVVESATPRGGTRCVEPQNMEQTLGQPCSATECVAGLVCVRTASTSLCGQVCDPDTNMGCDALGMDWECASRLIDTNWGVCVQLAPLCDGVTQAPCPADQACQFVSRRGMFELRCVRAGTGVDDSPCGAGTPGCARGFVCVREGNGSFCRKTCGGDPDCTAPKTCSSMVQNLRYCR